MSNTIDILCVGGPSNARMINMDRAHATTYIEFPLAVDETGNLLRYTRRKWMHPDTQKLYWIAARADDILTDEQIIVEITMANFQPAWDLN